MKHLINNTLTEISFKMRLGIKLLHYVQTEIISFKHKSKWTFLLVLVDKEYDLFMSVS